MCRMEDWEERYHNLYTHYQTLVKSMETKMEKMLIQCKTAEQDAKNESEQRDTLEDAMKQLGKELRDYRNKEQCYIDERTSLLSENAKLQKVLTTQNERNERNKKEYESTITKLRESVKNVRATLTLKHDEISGLKTEINRLKEENVVLNDTLTDMKNVASSKDLKVFNKYDELLSKYMSLFPNDEDSNRRRFFDKTTHSSNYAFRLLVQVCHDDVTSKFFDLKMVIPDPESMVEAILYHKIDIPACTYARTMQLISPNLFDECSVATSKSKDLTRFQIQNNQIEIGNARANFVSALMEAVSHVPGTSSSTSPMMDCDNISKCTEQDSCSKQVRSFQSSKEKAKAIGFD